MSGASRWLEASARLTRVPSITATSMTRTNFRAVIVHSLLMNEGAGKRPRFVSPYTEGREELDCGPVRGCSQRPAQVHFARRFRETAGRLQGDRGGRHRAEEFSRRRGDHQAGAGLVRGKESGADWPYLLGDEPDLVLFAGGRLG